MTVTDPNSLEFLIFLHSAVSHLNNVVRICVWCWHAKDVIVSNTLQIVIARPHNQWIPWNFLFLWACVDWLVKYAGDTVFDSEKSDGIPTSGTKHSKLSVSISINHRKFNWIRARHVRVIYGEPILVTIRRYSSSNQFFPIDGTNPGDSATLRVARLPDLHLFMRVEQRSIHAASREWERETGWMSESMGWRKADPLQALRAVARSCCERDIHAENENGAT